MNNHLVFEVNLELRAVFTKLYFLRNLLTAPISQSVCSLQASPAEFNVTFNLIGPIHKLRRKCSVVEFVSDMNGWLASRAFLNLSSLLFSENTYRPTEANCATSVNYSCKIFTTLTSEVKVPSCLTDTKHRMTMFAAQTRCQFYKTIFFVT